MRIISGILKGRSIDFLKNNETRPLKDAVRENIFNILIHSNLIEVKIKTIIITSLNFFSSITYPKIKYEIISLEIDHVTGFVPTPFEPNK